MPPFRLCLLKLSLDIDSHVTTQMLVWFFALEVFLTGIHMPFFTFSVSLDVALFVVSHDITSYGFWIDKIYLVTRSPMLQFAYSLSSRTVHALFRVTASMVITIVVPIMVQLSYGYP